MRELYLRAFSLLTRENEDGEVDVSVTFETTAFHIARMLAEAETKLQTNQQLWAAIAEFIGGYCDRGYDDGARIGLYRLWLETHPNECRYSFGGVVPIDWNAPRRYKHYYIKQVCNLIDMRHPLKVSYSQEWGYSVYDRLYFWVHMVREGRSEPYIGDIDERTHLRDDLGNVYKARGLDGGFASSLERPDLSTLIYKDSYTVCFPNRTYKGTPIITPRTQYVELVIYDLGKTSERVFRWDLPIKYPK
jgi:hypothetical protein